jgi:hypothetical protein
MRDFNQASLDEHLANLTRNLTPEQAQQVKERVREKATGGWFELPPEAIDGAFDLAGAVLNGIVALPDLGSAGGKVGSALSELTGNAGKLLGSVPDLGGSALSGLARLLGGAGDLAGNAGDTVSDLAGSAGAIVDVFSAVLDVAPDAGDLAGAILEALGDALSDW